MASKITPELLAKAKQAKSAEELIALAKENGTELSAEEAKTYFDQLHKGGELADEELDNVAGGCGDDDNNERSHYRRKVFPSVKACANYECRNCEHSAGACKCRPGAENTCGTCLHIRYQSDGSAFCNNILNSNVKF